MSCRSVRLAVAAGGGALAGASAVCTGCWTEAATIGALVDWLRTRGPGYAEAFKDTRAIRYAVNQEYVEADHPVVEGDEVAFFPPVTGG